MSCEKTDALFAVVVKACAGAANGSTTFGVDAIALRSIGVPDTDLAAFQASIRTAAQSPHYKAYVQAVCIDAFMRFFAICDNISTTADAPATISAAGGEPLVEELHMAFTAYLQENGVWRVPP